jgi:outer membrane protein TolC
LKYFYILIASLAISGCSIVGPDFRDVDEIKAPKELQIDNNATKDELKQWWMMFNDNKLDNMIEVAYKNNIDIKQAGLRILQSRALLGVQEGLKYPQMQTLSGNAITSLKNSKNVNMAGINFDIGWEADFWGKYARNIESAEANVYLSVSSYRDIMTTVVAEVARNYINYRIAQERIEYAKRNIAIQERVAKMTEIQFNSGNVSELDMQQARTQLYSTRAKLPALELSKVNSLNALSILLGMRNNDVLTLLKIDIKDNNKYIKSNNFHTVELDENVGNYINFSIIPEANIDPYKKIDISLIRRRPDIQMAQYKARSANAKIGATQALLYPSFTLVGNVGINTNDLSGNFVNFSDAIGVSAGPAFQWNIFQYGRIKNQIRYYDAAFEEAMLGYNKTVLQAMSEVSNALNGYVYTKLQLKENQKALKSTLRAFNLSAKQYNDGLVSYQRLLSTVEKLTITQDVYAQVKGLVAINSILLYKSLGGGWQYSKDKEYIPQDIKQNLKNSGVDWDGYLDNVRFGNE